jgi:two-component system response regulator DevR
MEFALAHSAPAREGDPRRRVYIVEDSDSIRARIVDMLGAIDGLDIVGEAENAPEAVAGIERTRPDAVLLDIQLAGSSGLEVLRTIHARTPEIVFIVLTNYPNPQYRRICMQSGASHFLDKTTEFSKVAGILSRHTLLPRSHASSTTVHTSH